jgi:hypothetical protein
VHQRVVVCFIIVVCRCRSHRTHGLLAVLTAGGGVPLKRLGAGGWETRQGNRGVAGRVGEK